MMLFHILDMFFFLVSLAAFYKLSGEIAALDNNFKKRHCVVLEKKFKLRFFLYLQLIQTE